MVNKLRIFSRFLLPACLITTLFILGGCAPTAQVTVPQGYRLPEQETIYVAPFVNTLVPDVVAESVFNDFVDTLNRKRNIPGVTFFAIIKDDLRDVDPKWLEKQAYISGELWSYIEKSGCCSTEIRIKTRLNLHQPGLQSPVQIFLPKETFFEHEKKSIETERMRFTRELATEMADQVLRMLRRP